MTLTHRPLMMYGLRVIQVTFGIASSRGVFRPSGRQEAPVVMASAIGRNDRVVPALAVERG
eukprot:10502603-Lingulodinium_polyedra.AAC.1